LTFFIIFKLGSRQIKTQGKNPALFLCQTVVCKCIRNETR